MKRALLALAVLGCVTAEAATVNVSWVNPVELTDGTPFPSSGIARTIVEYGTCNGAVFGTKSGEATFNGAVTSGTITLGGGTWCFRASTVATAAFGGTVSGFSNVAQRVIPFPAPRPPTLLDAIIAFFKRLFNRNVA